ncbi:Hypothetical predicted protein, partial [Pelobates cultripes]
MLTKLETAMQPQISSLGADIRHVGARVDLEEEREDIQQRLSAVETKQEDMDSKLTSA